MGNPTSVSQLKSSGPDLSARDEVMSGDEVIEYLPIH